MSGRTRKTKSASASASSTPVKYTEVTRTTYSTVQDLDEEVTESHLESVREEGSSSPLHISRSEEKEELSYLNDRLASYIDYVRSLEAAQEKHSRRITTLTESHRHEVTALKGTYEKELQALREELDRVSNERAAAEVARKHAEVANDDLKREKHQLIDENGALRRKLERAQSQLERETLLRTELENKLQTLQDQLNFQSRLHQEEKDQLSRKSVIEIEEEISITKDAEYESRLAEELRKFRAETIDELNQYREQLENDFQDHFAALKAASTTAASDANKAKRELYEMRSQWEQSQSDLQSARRRCDNLMKDLADQREQYEHELARLRESEAELRQQLEERIQEFTELLAVKIALDQEIATYRKLIESEEFRCNLPALTRASSFATKAGKGASKRVWGGSGNEDEESLRSEETISSSYAVERQGSGKVCITEVDTVKGHFVELQSHSTDDLPIGNWRLKYQADGLETIYKFNRNLILKAGEHMKIWSSESTQTHDPPANLVMKGLKFFTGRRINVSLMDPDGKEHASMNLSYHDKSLASGKRIIVHGKRRKTHREDGSCGLM